VTLKAVAFDIDGTLYPDAALRVRLLPFVIRHARLLMAMAEVREALHREAATKGSPARACSDLASFREVQARLVAERLHRPLEETRERIERVIYGELEECFARVPLYRGVRPALEALKAAGLALAVLSDFPVERKLEVLGIAKFFSVSRTSEECGLLKPATEPFLALARELGVEPRDLLYVGNSLRYDVAGAKAAGMPVAYKTSRSIAFQAGVLGRASGGADLAFSSWEELSAWTITRTTTTP
jgi:putative hydrolase of the HAD superfamily